MLASTPHAKECATNMGARHIEPHLQHLQQTTTATTIPRLPRAIMAIAKIT